MAALANAKHEAVLQAFLADPKRIGWRAWKKVYPKCSQHAAETAWSRLLKKPEVAERLREGKVAIATEVAETVAISAQRVFDELAKIGFANTQDYFNPDDSFVGMRNLTRDQAAAISGIEIEPVLINIKTGKGKKPKPVLANKVKFKLHDKRGALVDLGKHFGLFTPKDPGAGNDGARDERPLSDLDAARRVAFLLEKAARAAAPAKAKKKG